MIPRRAARAAIAGGLELYLRLEAQLGAVAEVAGQPLFTLDGYGKA